MRKIIQYILRILAKIVIWKNNPEIIAITGSVGKTSAKEAIYNVLRKKFKVRKNIKNYNNEIGAPLTILGLESGEDAFFSWLKVFFKAIAAILWSRDYPEILILEMGVDKPGDMDYMLGFIPVKIGIITAIGEFPTHLEFFPEKEKLIEEKAKLVKALSNKGLAVLNYDDLSVRMLGDELPQETKTFYYGAGQGADLKISNFQFSIFNLEKKRFGINFKLDYQGSVVPIKLNKVLGKQHCYAAAAAAAIGLHYGLNLVEISSSLIKYRSVPGRLNLISGIKKTWIIDDTYNSSPGSALAALDVLNEFPKVDDNGDVIKKIVVLGDMLELGVNTENGHRQVGAALVPVVDMLFVVGNRARFIADEAKKQGLAEDKIFEFSTVDEAKLKVQQVLEINDIILIKGSRAMKMEKVTKEIMAEPEKEKKLLVCG